MLLPKNHAESKNRRFRDCGRLRSSNKNSRNHSTPWTSR
jgi:hypothetical protein